MVGIEEYGFRSRELRKETKEQKDLIKKLNKEGMKMPQTCKAIGDDN